MISYGPFGNPVRAKIGLNRLIGHKLGVTRAANMGIMWRDGDQCQFLQPCLPYPNGYSELMVVTADHVRKPAPKLDDVSAGKMAWEVANDVGDAAFVYLSYAAATAAISVAVAAAADATLTAGVIFMLAFTAVELFDSFALLMADGAMTVVDTIDKATGTDYARSLKASKTYNFIETWGPIIALPAVAHDIFLASSIPRDVRLLTELRAQMLTRAKAVLREMRATEAFIGAEGDLAARDSYEFLKESVHELRENLVDIKRDLKLLTRVALPADAIGLINDEVNWHDIRDGAMADLTSMDVSIRSGFTGIDAAAGRWAHSAGAWLGAGTARAASHMPRQVGSSDQAARFGGIHNSPGEAKLKIKSMFPITLHLIGGTHAKRVKGKK